MLDFEEVRAYSTAQFKQSGFDATGYQLPEVEGTFAGSLMCKRWGKKCSLIAYFHLDNYNKIMCSVWQNTDYLGLDKIPMGFDVTVTFSKSSTGKIYLRNVESASGIYILYLLFTLILRRISKREPNQSQRVIYTPELRAAIRQMDKYSAETRLLCRHKIETPEQLTAFIENRCELRKTLEHERERVYNRMKSAKTPEKLQELKSKRDELSTQIKVIRKELFYAHDVFKRWRDIQEKLRAQREFQAKQIAQEKTKQIKSKERGYSR